MDDEVRTLDDLINAARAHRPDVVVLDVGLINAWSTPSSSLPPYDVLAVTTEEMPTESLLNLARAGVRGVVRLADLDAHIVTAIRTVAAGGSWVSPTLGGDLLVAMNGRKASSSVSDEPVPDPITSREIDVLSLIAKGYSNAEIAAHLFITTNTVKYHVRNLLIKFDARDRAHLVAISCRHNVPVPRLS